VGKGSVKGTVWKTSARTVSDRSHRFRRISVLPIHQSPQFHVPQIRFNHVLQLKKQPFNSGARTYRQVGPALVLVWLGQTQFPSSSAIQNCFQCTASASGLTSALFSSPKVWRTVHYFYSRLLPSRAHPPSSPSRPHDATYIHKHSYPYREGCRNHLPCCSSWDPSHGHATSGK
jgi:hypothetical protein